MPQAEFFARLGLFAVKGFLDEEACAALREAMRAAPAKPSKVAEGDDAYKLDEKVRKTLSADVPSETKALVAQRLSTIKPALEEHFRTPLGRRQDLQFLIYRPGDFFSQHADGGDNPDEPPGIRARRVSVVVFLTRESAAADSMTHAGGSLVFYGLLDDERAKSRGLPLAAEEGLLVAFRADTIHSVSTVTAGERLSIVCWFESPS